MKQLIARAVKGQYVAELDFNDRTNRWEVSLSEYGASMLTDQLEFVYRDMAVRVYQKICKMYKLLSSRRVPGELN